MLGAGASISSGVPPTQAIVQDLVARHGHDLTSGNLNERFDRIWKRSTREQRRLLLQPFLAGQGKQPAAGYLALARLIRDGCFDLVVTFNYDDLLEQALRQIGFHDYKLVIRGETDLAEVARLVEEPVAPVTILKLHGSLRSTDTFLFTFEEMANYPPPLEELVARITRRPIVVCGYAFNDLCVIKAFSTAGEAVFCANPSGAPANLQAILASRQSSERVIDGDLGRSDAFFTALEEEVRAAAMQEPAPRPRLNPFKFLDSYDVADRDWFFGRKRLTRRLLGKLEAEGGRPASLHLVGPEKVGKTSFVRAGLLAYLPADRYQTLYLRCRPELDRQIRELGAQKLDRDPDEVPLGEALDALAPADGRHLVLVLDQFERVLQTHSRNDQGWQQLAPLFRGLCQHGRPWLTVLFVSVEGEGLYYKLIVKARLVEPIEPDEVKALPPRLVEAIVQRSSLRSGFGFEPEVVRALVEKLGSSGRRFTLAHLQAICYLLVKNGWLDEAQYRQHIGHDLEGALDAAINACDFLNYVEDLPLREGRCLLRSIMKVVSEPSKQRIAAFLKERFAEIVDGTTYPEPL
jgi:hypothetical protein